jgi:hypothetical protein
MNTDFHGFLSVFIRVHLRPTFRGAGSELIWCSLPANCLWVEL